MRLIPSAIILFTLAIFVGGCNGNSSTTPATAAPVEKHLSLPAGTSISLVLMKELESGREKPGDDVPFLVGKDVRVEGVVVIPAGSRATGTVSWSRGEGTLSGIMRQPARLDVMLVSVECVQNQSVAISAKPDQAVAFRFDRNNTATEAAKPVDAPTEIAQKAVTKFLETGDDSELREANVRKLIDDAVGHTTPDKDVDSAKQIISAMKNGASTQALLSGAGSGGLTTILQFASVAESLGNRLQRALQGRKIRAHVGTAVEAFTMAPVEITVTAKPSEFKN